MPRALPISVRRLRSRSHLVLASALLLGLQSGCGIFLLAGGAGAGGILYATGELKASEPHPLQAVIDASRTAISELSYDPIDDDRATVDEKSARIVARTASGDDVDIRLHRRNAGRTDVRIRVGVFGDETLSRLILEKIQQLLRG